MNYEEIPCNKTKKVMVLLNRRKQINKSSANWNPWLFQIILA